MLIMLILFDTVAPEPSFASTGKMGLGNDLPRTVMVQSAEKDHYCMINLAILK